MRGCTEVWYKTEVGGEMRGKRAVQEQVRGGEGVGCMWVCEVEGGEV